MLMLMFVDICVCHDYRVRKITFILSLMCYFFYFVNFISLTNIYFDVIGLTDYNNNKVTKAGFKISSLIRICFNDL